ncbi:hypothetical protein C8R43DRAFT_1016121 [Mycena crocata]|nr:hypothetical protein C8R43DRAFT_1016121 [Mycena crocata]
MPGSVLAADRARLGQIDELIRELERERASIRARISEYKYPILTLPNEITSEIFIHFLPPYPLCPPTIGRRSPTLLTHICRKWRKIAHATPALWRAISLTFGNPDIDQGEKKAALLKLWLTRSGACPVSIQMEHSDTDSVHELMDVVVTSRARWEYLALNWIPADTLPLLVGPTPLLRQLEMALAAPPYSPLLFDTAPLLQTVNLGCFAIPNSNLPWVQLTSLTLQRVSVSECTPILQQTPDLVKCVLAIHLEEGTNHLVDVTLSRLESLALIRPVPQDNPATQYISSIVAPALRELQVAEECLHEDPVTFLASFISKSGCNLQRVRITGARFIPKAAYRASFPSIPTFLFNERLTSWVAYVADDPSDDEDEESTDDEDTDSDEDESEDEE